MTRYLKQNAVCVINCSWDKSELEKQLPAKMRKDLAEKQALMANGSGAIPQTFSHLFSGFFFTSFTSQQQLGPQF